MKVSGKETTLSPLLRREATRKSAVARVVGAISKARVREWIRHITRSRKEWN